MGGETIATEAICLDIRPWSRTSHVVSWLTPTGRVVTIVKGAVRPKSAFLGQYDLNYTCDILYYARAKGEVHALRDCAPRERRDGLRRDFRALAVAGYFRRLAGELAPTGPDSAQWFELLSSHLSSLIPHPPSLIPSLLHFELESLRLAGLAPDFSGYDREAEWSAFSVERGTFDAAGGRSIRVSREVADYLTDVTRPPKNPQTPLDAARVIGVFYRFHVDCLADIRRAVLGMIA